MSGISCVSANALTSVSAASEILIICMQDFAVSSGGGGRGTALDVCVRRMERVTSKVHPPCCVFVWYARLPLYCLPCLCECTHAVCSLSAVLDWVA